MEDDERPGEYRRRVHDEHVVLDIGDDVGALVLYTPPEFRGREIEVSRVGDDAERVHTEVLERVVNGSILLAAVYPELRAGAYRIWVDQPGLRDRFTITGGTVTEADWRLSRIPPKPVQDGAFDREDPVEFG